MKIKIPVPGSHAVVVFDPDKVTGVSTSNEYRERPDDRGIAVIRELTGRTTLTLRFDKPGDGPTYE